MIAHVEADQETRELASAFWPEGTTMLTTAYRDLAVELEKQRRIVTIARCCNGALRLVRSAYDLRDAAGMTEALAGFVAHVVAHD